MTDCRSTSAQKFAALDEVAELRQVAQDATAELARALEQVQEHELARWQAERDRALAEAELVSARQEIVRLTAVVEGLGGHA